MLCYKLVGDNSEFILLIHRISSIGIYEQDSSDFWLVSEIVNIIYCIILYRKWSKNILSRVRLISNGPKKANRLDTSIFLHNEQTTLPSAVTDSKPRYKKVQYYVHWLDAIARFCPITRHASLVYQAILPNSKSHTPSKKKMTRFFRNSLNKHEEEKKFLLTD